MKTIKKLSALIAALILLFTTAHADWQPAEGNGPLFAQLFSLLEDDETDGSAVEGILQEICRQNEGDGEIARAIVDHWNAVTDPAYRMYLYRGGETAGELEDSGPEFSGKHAFVVLGYALSDGEMQEELIGRCDAAAAAARSFPDAVLITTGGATGPNNPYEYTEAGMMKDYLVQKHGIDAGRIFTETEAMTTAENAVNAFRIMREQGIETFTVVTSNYHQLWAQVLFNAMAAVWEKDTGYRVRMAGNYSYPARAAEAARGSVRKGLRQLTSLFMKPVRTE
ncbi:MAG: YdcF family protein [Clostridia bacterium]|nr:YdcF family protein [Clostridia bacterium]